VFDNEKLSVLDGAETLLEFKKTTTAGEYIISASNFQVDTAGAFTASAGIIEGDTIMRGKLEVLDPAGVQTHTLYARGADYVNIATHDAIVQIGNNIDESANVRSRGHSLIIVSESAAGVMETRHRVTKDTHLSAANGDSIAAILMGTSTYSDVNGNATTLETTDALYGALTSSGGTNPTALDSSQAVQSIPTSTTSRQPYALIGQRGLGHGNGFEANGRYDEADHPTGSAELTVFYKNGQISANSSPGSEIAGDRIKTGFIQSNNWTGVTGTKGTLIDLNEGKMIMRSGSKDVFNFDAVQATASIAGWTFTDEKFFSNPTQPVRGININKDKGIRGRDAAKAFSLTSSNAGNYNFGPIAVYAEVAEQVCTTYCPSDERLKHNVVFLGTSLSGIPIYEFSYIGNADRYQGTMAQDLLMLGKHEAVTTQDDGYYAVNYDIIDVEFKQIKENK